MTIGTVPTITNSVSGLSDGGSTQVTDVGGNVWNISVDQNGNYSVSSPQSGATQYVGLNQGQVMGFLTGNASGSFQSSPNNIPQFGIGDPTYNGGPLTQAQVQANSTNGSQSSVGFGGGSGGEGGYGTFTPEQLGQGTPGWLKALGEAGFDLTASLIGGAALGPVIGTVGAGAVSGAGAGATTSGLTGGNPLTAALEGGVGGALSSGLSSNLGGISDYLTGGSSSTPSLSGVSSGENISTQSVGGGTAPGLSGSATAAPSSIGASVGGDVSAPAATNDGWFSRNITNPISNLFSGSSSGPTSTPTTNDISFNPSGTTPSPGTSPTLGSSGGFTGSSVGSDANGPFSGIATNTSSNLSAPTPVGGSSMSSGSLDNFLAGSPATPSPGVGFTNTGTVGPVAGAAVPAAAAGGNSFTNLISNPSFGSFTDFLGKNAGGLVTGGGLLYNALTGQSDPKGTNQLTGEAQQLGAQGTQLQNYLTTGTLPPGVQTGIDQAAAQAKAAIQSQYASRGMSGSSAEATDLANVDASAASQGAQIAMNLLNTGVQESGLAANIYEQLIQNTLAQDQGMNSLFGAFGAALGGGGNLKLQLAS